MLGGGDSNPGYAEHTAYLAQGTTVLQVDHCGVLRSDEGLMSIWLKFTFQLLFLRHVI